MEFFWKNRLKEDGTAPLRWILGMQLCCKRDFHLLLSFFRRISGHAHFISRQVFRRKEFGAEERVE
jgi:hypothetical protein